MNFKKMTKAQLIEELEKVSSTSVVENLGEVEKLKSEIALLKSANSSFLETNKTLEADVNRLKSQNKSLVEESKVTDDKIAELQNKLKNKDSQLATATEKLSLTIKDCGKLNDELTSLKRELDDTKTYWSISVLTLVLILVFTLV